MRMKFREFYFYAIKGILADPIKEGSCPSDCVDEIHCCAFLSAFNINTKEAHNDLLCMRQNIVSNFG